MKKQKFYKSIVPAVMTVAALGMVLNCAPKKGANSNENGKAAAQKTDPSSIASLVKSVDFSKLENGKDDNKSIYAVYSSLKEGNLPADETLALAIAQQHLKEVNGGKSTDSKESELSESLGKWAKSTKAKSPEMLREVYGLLEKESKKRTKKGNSANSLQTVLSTNEVSAYSAPIFIATLWLKSGSDIPMNKALAVITNNGLSLGEIRTNDAVITFDSAVQGDEITNLGKLETLVSAKQTRLVGLKLFLIHEVLKSFTTNPVEFANRVLARSAVDLSIKPDASLQVQSSVKIDATKISQSALLMGSSLTLSEGEVEVRKKKTEPNNKEDTNKEQPKLGSAGDETPEQKAAREKEEEEHAQAEKQEAKYSLDLKVNGTCYTRAGLMKLLSVKERAALFDFVKLAVGGEKVTLEILKEQEAQLLVLDESQLTAEEIKEAEALNKADTAKVKKLVEAAKAQLEKPTDKVYLLMLTRKVSGAAQKSELSAGFIKGGKFVQSSLQNMDVNLSEMFFKKSIEIGDPKGKEKDQKLMSLQLFSKGTCATK